ncbi:site-specific integrase [Agrobacterium tumefaciens]|uniref:site-specific integrase n=1 Tax=Agrobacterium tumefaciens TaxID=358 RepID=UPI000AA0A3C6
MYLSHRKSGVRFQIAVPIDLQPRLGRTPIRIPLGIISATLARRAARLLSGHAERLFIAARLSGTGTMESDARDIIIAELTAQIDALLDSFQQYKESAEELRQNAVSAARLEAENKHLEDMGQMSGYIDSIADGMQVLEEKVNRLPKKAIGTDVGSTVAELQTQFLDLSREVRILLDGGPTRPLLSEALDDWTEIRGGFGIDPKKIATDHNRILDFIEFAGDKPANKYSFYDIQRFANLLARVPGNYSKIPQIKGKPRQDAADYNDRLPADQRLPTLSVKSIEDNYLSPLRGLFRDVAAEHSFRSPLSEVTIRISTDATPSVERQPFGVAELNLWFAHASKEARADMKWLPLLGTITGARIAELIYLQGKDIYRMKGDDGTHYWVLDLRTDIVTENGGTSKRKVKNKPSRRLIAIHEVFETVGFIDYAQSRKADEWIFPAAFYYGKRRVADPADAASKRMNRMLQDVGIHKRLEFVFHSTRHTAKDIMRLAHVDERTHDLQTGHALTTVSKRYGSKHLVQQEIEVLRSLPMPEGLDLSPYTRQG